MKDKYRWVRGLERASEDLNRASERWLERTKIKLAADEHIKTENFSSDYEREVMMEAAAREKARRNELERELAAGSPELRALYEESLAKNLALFPGNASVATRRLCEQSALEHAKQQLESNKLMESNPRYKELIEKYRKVLDDLDA